MGVAARDLFNHLWIHFLLQIWTLYAPVTSDCTGSTIYTNSSGVVTSPGYPSTFYGDNLNCTWYINLGTDEYPAINITDLYLDYSEDCWLDFLEITDQGNVLARLCGTTNELPIFLIGESNVVAVRFVTDNGGTDRGFSFEWATSYEPATVRTTSYEPDIYFTTTAGPVTENIFFLTFIGIFAGAFILVIVCGVCITIMKKCAQWQEEQLTPAPSPRPATSKTNKVNVQPPVKRAPSKPKPKKKPPPDGPHIFLSFDASDHRVAMLLKEKIKQKGYRVYSGARKSSMMVNPIKKSAAIVPVLTKEFQNSKQCQKEIQFADKCKKPLVPVRVVKGFRLEDGWLGLLLAATVVYDLSTPDTVVQQMIHFLEAIENVGSSAKLPEEEDDVDEEAEAEAETAKAEASKAEAANIEAAKVEAAKAEAAKTEAANIEAAKVEAAKAEAAKTEAAKTEAAKTEAAKTEAAKTETVQAQLTVVNEQTSIGLSL